MLKKLKLNLNQVKKLIIKREYGITDFENNNQTHPVIEDIFFFKNILNDLVYLQLSDCGNLINKNYLAQNINNFMSLKYLYLNGFDFDFLKLELDNLIILELGSCKNIAFKENIFLNLKSLNLSFSSFSLIKSSNLSKFPELEKLQLNFKDNKLSLKIKDIIDFSIY